MGAENIQSPNMVIVKVKGMQNMAIIKSAMARLMRNTRRLVARERNPSVNTAMTMRLPMTDNNVVILYRIMSIIRESYGTPNCGMTSLNGCDVVVTLDDVMGVTS